MRKRPVVVIRRYHLFQFARTTGRSRGSAEIVFLSRDAQASGLVDRLALIVSTHPHHRPLAQLG